MREKPNGGLRSAVLPLLISTTIMLSIGQVLEVFVPQAKLWLPDSPFFYNMKVSLISNGKVTDEADSYFAMRKVSVERDEKGIVRLQLNNRDQFMFGPLDQRWWPDGLYTASTDEVSALFCF